MKAITSIVILFLVSSFLYSCSDDDGSNINIIQNLEFRQELDVPYGIDSDQLFDIYLPANRTLDTKVIILVHGGGWTEGDKESMNTLTEFFLEDLPDIAVVNMNYRLADEVIPPYPMQIDDISAVVNFLKSNQDNYVISDKIGFIGASAGGHLSMLYSYAFDTDNEVQMVASIVGPTNFTDPAYLNSEEPLVQELLAVFGSDASTAFLEEVSPYHQVTTSAPPSILFYGGQDPLVPTSQGFDMRDKLETLGITHQFTLYPDAGHGWIGPELLDTWTKLQNFIEVHLQ